MLTQLADPRCTSRQVRLRCTGKQLQEQLSCLGLSTTQLSPAAAGDLQCIAAAAQALRLQNCQHSAFLLALSQLRIQESQLACAQVYVCLCSHKGTVTPMLFPQNCCNAMQHESQELATWLAHKQSSAVQQLKKLRLALDSAQSNAIAATDQTNGYHHNIAMLAQKEQQYTHQLQVLEEKLDSVQYSPLVSSLPAILTLARSIPQALTLQCQCAVATYSSYAKADAIRSAGKGGCCKRSQACTIPGSTTRHDSSKVCI